MKECQQCGKCCLSHIIAYASEEDIRRWRGQGREDIISSVNGSSISWAGDKIVYARGGEIRACLFHFRRDGKSWCEIYETRPGVCKNFMPESSRLCSLWQE